jgi:aspartate carbamoyltransferase regulatory subunit
MFTLSCKVDAVAKYSDGITVSMVVNSNNNQRASCPYCASKFKDNEELSKHIDGIHHGSGLLEGDSRRW